MLVGARGTYELANEIASGGTATVHLARVTGPAGSSRVVAIKRLHPHLSKDPTFRAMLEDEARLVTRIHHPNVCAVLDVVSENDSVALVLEYVDGASLAAITEELENPVPPAIAVAIASALLAGLSAAHEATDDDGAALGLVHRDVSPQNVLLGADGIARITDFGTAKALGRITATADGIVKGKVAYMPPEQIRGDTLDRRTDLYSAAVVLWEMLAGRRLFEGNGPSTMLDVLEQPLATLRDLGARVPEELDVAVMRGLSRDPDARFKDATSMISAIERAQVPATTRTISEWVKPLLAKVTRGAAHGTSSSFTARRAGTRTTGSARAMRTPPPSLSITASGRLTDAGEPRSTFPAAPRSRPSVPRVSSSLAFSEARETTKESDARAQPPSTFRSWAPRESARPETRSTREPRSTRDTSRPADSWSARASDARSTRESTRDTSRPADSWSTRASDARSTRESTRASDSWSTRSGEPRSTRDTTRSAESWAPHRVNERGARESTRGEARESTRGEARESTRGEARESTRGEARESTRRSGSRSADSWSAPASPRSRGPESRPREGLTTDARSRFESSEAPSSRSRFEAVTPSAPPSRSKIDVEARSIFDTDGSRPPEDAASVTAVKRTSARLRSAMSGRPREDDPFEPFDLIYADANGAAALYGRLLVQVRRGSMAPESVERIYHACRLALLRTPRGEIGSIAILEAGATIANRETRKLQWKVMGELLGSPRRPYLCVVTMGRDIGSTLLRSASRLYARGNPRVCFSADLDECVGRIANHMSTTTREVHDIVEHARAMVRDLASTGG